MGTKNKKYILTEETKIWRGHILHRIQAVRDFGDVRRGDKRGWVESENNLSHNGLCWVYDEAIATEESEVCGNAQLSSFAVVYGHAKIFGNSQVYGQAEIYEYSEIFDGAKVFNKARVYGHAKVFGNAKIYGNAKVFGYTVIFEYARIYSSAQIFGYALIKGYAQIYNFAQIDGNVQIIDFVEVFGSAKISGNVRISDYVQVFDNAQVSGDFLICGYAKIGSNAIVKYISDFFVFKNTWSSGRYFTYTKSNKIWFVGCFSGTGEQLIEKAYRDSKLSGRMYEEYVRIVKQLEELEKAEV